MKVYDKSVIFLVFDEPSFDVDVVGSGDADLFWVEALLRRMSIALWVAFRTVGSIGNVSITQYLPGI